MSVMQLETFDSSEETCVGKERFHQTVCQTSQAGISQGNVSCPCIENVGLDVGIRTSTQVYQSKNVNSYAFRDRRQLFGVSWDNFF